MHFYRQLPVIEAMTFDLDDTLYDNRPVIRRVEAPGGGLATQTPPDVCE